MKNIMFKAGALCTAFVLAAVALASCTDERVDEIPDEGEVVTPDTPDTPAGNSNLTTVRLASFAGDAGRVTYAADARAEGGGISASKGAGTANAAVATRADAAAGTLELIASIANPSKPEGFFEFTPENGGRYMSATSIHYDAVGETYYVTYHMQGNNYNTTLETETAGAIQSFKIVNDKVDLGNGFRAADPSKLDFDFNHIYFDNTDRRIVAVGHDVRNGNQKNTNAVIGVFDPQAGTYSYTTVKTGEKEYDDDGKSLGYKDAGDANCVVRTNDATPTSGQYHGWNIYFVATRKGMAVLHADEANLFSPYLNSDGMNYFVKTPGSAKYVAPTGTSSWYGLLYLSDEHTGDVAYDTKSEARIAKLSVQTGNNSGLGNLQGWDSPFTHLDPTADIRDFYSQFELPKEITPIDGKNTLCILGNSEFYAALGVNGMYYENMDAGKGVKRFDSRPVNCVAVDNYVNESGHSLDGYLYVANGSKLTILDRSTLKEIVSYQAPSKDEKGNDIESSANFIAVRKVDDNNEKYSDRYVAVAFGQDGVKIFKFTPPAQ